ncbi:TMEM165/GDT1 family protein [Mycoplasmatota bacterium WC44]
MVVEFLRAVTLIFFAEMGDKTQILAMAFATKYNVKKVLLGIVIGSFLNHGLAVLLGSYLSEVIPVDTIQIIAGFSFVAFALWTLKNDEEEDKESSNVKYGPIVTVALAFFIGELGDKTQLAAITLAADANFPVFILIGTVTGMVITGGIGIFIGRKLGNKIPEFTIKIVSASVFMFFGVMKLATSLPNEYLKYQYILLFIVIVAVISYVLLKPTLEMRNQRVETRYKRSAQRLYEFYNELSLKVEDICLTEGVCGNCRTANCVIGYTKQLLKETNSGGVNIESHEIDTMTLKKDFNKSKIIRSLAYVIDFLEDNKKISNYDRIIFIKNNFEKILFNGEVIEFKDKEDYMSKLYKIDNHIYNRMMSYLY